MAKKNIIGTWKDTPIKNIRTAKKNDFADEPHTETDTIIEPVCPTCQEARDYSIAIYQEIYYIRIILCALVILKLICLIARK
ncbi:MAG: hypothetical protein ACI30A_06650 [Paludibacteraceae bacterium]